MDDRCTQGHALTPENIYTRSNGRRECRTCRAASAQKRYIAKYGNAPLRRWKVRWRALDENQLPRQHTIGACEASRAWVIWASLRRRKIDPAPELWRGQQLVFGRGASYPLSAVDLAGWEAIRRAAGAL